VLANDPRIKRIKADEKAARNAKKGGAAAAAKPLSAAEKKKAEEQKKKEEAEKKEAEKKALEASKGDREAAKKAKEAARKNLKKWKKVCRSPKISDIPLTNRPSLPSSLPATTSRLKVPLHLLPSSRSSSQSLIS
jgi:DnaJ family protein C protein 2